MEGSGVAQAPAITVELRKLSLDSTRCFTILPEHPFLKKDGHVTSLVWTSTVRIWSCGRGAAQARRV